MKKLLFGLGLGWIAAYFFDPDHGSRRRAVTRDRSTGTARSLARRGERAGRGVAAQAYGIKQQAAHRQEQPKEFDDVTLARKVETELFRPADVPKGQINVDAAGGKVTLRGEVESNELIAELVARAKSVQGVDEVESLLHLPNESAPMHQ